MTFKTGRKFEIKKYIPVYKSENCIHLRIIVTTILVQRQRVCLPK
jgi:hypothetical protein